MEVYALREVRKMQRRKQESVDSARVAVVVRRRTVTLATASVTAAKPKAAVAAAKKKGEAVAATKEVDVGAVLKKASASAFRGGIAGFAAGVIQVGSFMWLRTVMNYQYVNGGTMMGAITTLFKEGGIPRFYKGVSFAIVQNPLSRFGDTAANTGVLALMEAFFPGSPVAVKTALASVGGASWRIALTPVDTFKTTLQVQGNSAFLLLKQKVASGGILQLYSGASANFVANWVGNYPWFVTFNFLQQRIPKPEDQTQKLVRNAFIGICSSAVSDTVSNSLRVIKTVKQTTADANLGYVGVVKAIIERDGLKGLFGRGLKTRLLTNIMQSMVFSVAWKAIEEALHDRAQAKEQAKKAVAGVAKKGAAAAKKPAATKAKAKTASITLARLPAGLAGSAL